MYCSSHPMVLSANYFRTFDILDFFFKHILVAPVYPSDMPPVLARQEPSCILVLLLLTLDLLSQLTNGIEC